MLHYLKEGASSSTDTEAAAEALRAEGEAAMVRLAGTALQEGLPMAQMAVLGVSAAQLAAAAAEGGAALPFELREYEALLERMPAQERQPVAVLRAADEEEDEDGGEQEEEEGQAALM
jgi:hypothetical protein